MRAGVIGLALTLLVALVLASAPAAAVTRDECQADYRAMMEAAETNRNIALAEIELQLLSATPGQKAALEEMREQVWLQEEQERRQAGFYRNDCLKAAQSR